MHARLGAVLCVRRSLRKTGESVFRCDDRDVLARRFARQAHSSEKEASKKASRVESSKDDGRAASGRKKCNYVPAKSGPIDGRAYADWGKLKWRPVKKQSEAVELKETTAEKKSFKESLPKETGGNRKQNLKREALVNEKVLEEQEGRSEGLRSSSNREEEACDLLKFAITSLKSSEAGSENQDQLANENIKNRVLEVLSESQSDPEAKVQVWCPSFRDRVEQALVDKGLILETGDPRTTALAAGIVTASDEDDEKTDEELYEDDNGSQNKRPDAHEESEGTEEEEEESSAFEALDQEEGELEGDESDTDPDVDEFHVKQAEKKRSWREASCGSTEQFHSKKPLDEQQKRAAKTQAKALLEALEEEDEEDGDSVRNQDQKSLRVGIIGAPNAGKSCLLNYLVGSKVSAVSRKTNTTRNEILGVLTEADTQLLFYDTPGLMVDWKGQAVRQDTRNRVQSAWAVTDHCEVLIVLVDAHRHIDRPDQRVKRLVDRLGAKRHPTQKRVLCLNKVDLIRNKRELVPVAQELGGLPGFDSVFMISGLRGSGVRHLKEYLFDQSVFRPWEEEKGAVTDMNPVQIAKEVVWEHILDNLHQEIPYELKHKHMSWKVLRDQSVRIEQQLVVHTENQKKILVGKKGALIRKIGMSANEELCARLGRKVHLILDVKVSSDNNMYANVENVPDEMWI